MYLNTFKHIQTHVLRVNYNFDLASLTIWVQTRISNYFDTVENDYCWNFSGLTTIFTNTAILIKTNNQMNWSGFFTTSYEWRKKQVFFLKKKNSKTDSNLWFFNFQRPNCGWSKHNFKLSQQSSSKQIWIIDTNANQFSRTASSTQIRRICFQVKKKIQKCKIGIGSPV